MKIMQTEMSVFIQYPTKVLSCFYGGSFVQTETHARQDKNSWPRRLSSIVAHQKPSNKLNPANMYKVWKDGAHEAKGLPILAQFIR